MGLGYCDLSLKARNKAEAHTLCRAAVEAGYKVVAINTEVDANVFAKKGKKDPTKTLPSPLDLNSLHEEFEGKIQILQRLTVQIEDSLQAHKLFQSSQAMEYDVLAVQPLNPQAFQHACSTMEIDLIAFDWSDCKPLKAARKVVRQALERGVVFEVQYCPLILSSTTRRNVIALTHALHAVSRGKASLLVTSGAAAEHHFRSPTDVSNLALLMGQSEEAAKNCMKQTARKVLLNAQARKTGRGMVFAQKSRPFHEKIEEENGTPPNKKRKNVDTPVVS